MGGKGSGSMKKGMPARKGSGAVFKAQKADALDPTFTSNLVDAERRMLNLSLQPYDRKDADQLVKRVDDWLQICFDTGIRPLVTNLALATGITKEQLWNIAKNGNRSPSGRGANVDLGDEGEQIIKKVYQFLEDSHFQASLDFKSGMPAPTSIFTAKNWYGYKDVQDVAVSARSPLDDTDQDAATIVAKYLPEESQATIDVEPERLSDE